MCAADEPATAVAAAHVGGSPFNVAVGLARLARRSAARRDLERLPWDAVDARIEQEGVSTTTVVRTSAPTTLSLVALDARGVAAVRVLRDPWRRSSVDAGNAAATCAAHRALHFGSYATVVEPTASALRALVEAQYRSCVVSYDPNVRLNVEPSLARWSEMVQWMLPRTHLLKVSEEDLSLLYPVPPWSPLAAAWL